MVVINLRNLSWLVLTDFFSGKKLRNPGGFPRPPRFLFFPTDREIVALDLHIGPTRRSKTVEIVKILSQDVKKDDDE
jgi:hypothetical protein